MQAIWALSAVTFLLVGLCAIEALIHRRSLKRVPIRIHVNGTRGKSSVTRLIAGALREAGVRTCAKTTGALPRFIGPDGRERPVVRPGRPNVIEQIKIVRQAARCRAEALVVECMAIQPQLQWLSESKLVRATHAVVTNARSDHVDVMGPGVRDVALALAGTVPPGGKLFTAERRYLEIFEEAAADRAAELIAVGPDEIAGIDPGELARFGYIEHEENLALALRVCAALGVDRATALAGMWKSAPDPGALTTHEMTVEGGRLLFVNGFAANDPESAERVYRISLRRAVDADARIVIWNCRSDRPDRSHHLAEACVAWPPADHHLLIGSGTAVFARSAIAAGMEPSRLHSAEGRDVAHIVAEVLRLGGGVTLAMGMGNIGGVGLELIGYFSSPASLRETA